MDWLQDRSVIVLGMMIATRNFLPDVLAMAWVEVVVWVVVTAAPAAAGAVVVAGSATVVACGAVAPDWHAANATNTRSKTEIKPMVFLNMPILLFR